LKILKNKKSNIQKEELIQWKNDPLGYALYDYLEGNSKAIIDIQTNLDDESMSAEIFFRQYHELVYLEKLALQNCIGTVLDIGAGAGCHTLALQDFDVDVTALEISAGAVEVMKLRDVQSIIHSDVFDYKAAQYDTLILLMNGIGVCGTLAGMNKMLTHFKSLLNPGGQILFDSCDIVNAFYEVDGSAFIDNTTGYYGNVVFNMEYKGIKSRPFKWLYVDQYTMKEYAEMNGFHFEILGEGNSMNYLGRLTLAQ